MGFEEALTTMAPTSFGRFDERLSASANSRLLTVAVVKSESGKLHMVETTVPNPLNPQQSIIDTSGEPTTRSPNIAFSHFCQLVQILSHFLLVPLPKQIKFSSSVEQCVKEPLVRVFTREILWQIGLKELAWRYTVSFDVCNLFTCLDHKLVLTTLEKPLTNFNLELPSNTILYLIDICLEFSYFCFNNNIYHQVNGIPMGSPLSPFLADLVLNCLDTLVNERFNTTIKYWARYVDDVMAIVATDHIEKTLAFLNSFHPLLKFTTENESNGFLPFLDILFENKLSSNKKPSHSPVYLHASSFSPICHKISLVKTLTKGAFTHCSTDELKYIELNTI
ncbi:hypothetical protein LAZ67_8001167 [Cordylochernes scorpioides]|uniref:Reverse transcriptase domain-containing protein n=1 Tax=Cordylochernes scorpioides TaxID=51811 RepID=A0ABY6KSU6_9ARAC|nr:hypothetical protein LAZ67_8001167 [Cordylochernes scorpioides]